MTKRILLLSAGHGLNDLIAGFFLGWFATNNNDLLQTGIAVTLYNILAFGGQYPVAMFIEKYGNSKKLLVASYLMNTAAILLFLFLPSLAIILAGVASAIYHVAGGSYCAQNNKAVHIGMFAAPGVMGLILGGFLAWQSINIIPFLFILSTSFLFIIYRLPFHVQAKESPVNKSNHSAIDQHDIIMILLLLVISLRSATWNIFQLIYENNFEWLIAIAIAAAAGKMIGGWLADKIGWRIYFIFSTLLATPLLTFFKRDIVMFCIGIFLLQSGIPATTSLLINSLKGRTAVGISLSFGTAIIIGSVAILFPVSDLLLFLPYMMLFSVLLVFFGYYRKKRMQQIPA